MKTLYFTVNGQIRMQRSTGDVRSTLLFPDALGNVSAVRPAESTDVKTVSYTPYGLGLNPYSRAGWVGTRGYRANPYRRTPSQYVRARHFDNRTGSWTTRDPLWPFEPSNIYVDSSPLTAIDPSGQRADWQASNKGAPGKGPCSASMRSTLLRDLKETNRGFPLSEQLNPQNMMAAIKNNACCQAIATVAGRRLDTIMWKYTGRGEPNAEQLIRELIADVLFCIMCRESGGRRTLCTSYSGGIGNHGFLGASGQDIKEWGTGNSDIKGIVNNNGYRRQMEVLAQLFCAKACQLTPGCRCSAWDQFGTPRPIVFLPLPGKKLKGWPTHYPYLPHPGASQGGQDFIDCLKSMGRSEGGGVFPF